jgi:CheY-like chemotaxis protein
MSKTLLLADDSVVIQKLVGLSFANEDVEIVSTDNGDDAVIKAREIRPDVVLADVVMPGKSGYEVCEAIKNDSALAHIPVLLLTGTFEAFDETRSVSVGATGHITKPFEAQALVERVKSVMKNAARPAPPVAAKSQASPVESLFDDHEALLAPSGGEPSRASRNLTGYLGRTDSLDVTPSISEEDLGDVVDADLFGPPGEIGGPSFGSTVPPDLSVELAAEPIADEEGDDGRSEPVSAEDTAITMLEDSDSPLDADADAVPEVPLAEDFGFDDPLDLEPLPIAPVDLDSAFDPEPVVATAPSRTSAPPKIQVVSDDANAMTSRSFGRSAAVTDLDEMLAAPVAPTAADPLKPTPIGRLERRPEPPTLLDFGPTEQADSDLDFGFDVSEQAPIANVDLLEESFSSLLDVSESQVLSDSPPRIPEPPFESEPIEASAGLEPETSAIDDFDVSSSDLSAPGSAFQAPPLPSAAMSAAVPPPLPPSASVPRVTTPPATPPAMPPPPATPPATHPSTPPPIPRRPTQSLRGARPEFDLDLFSADSAPSSPPPSREQRDSAASSSEANAAAAAVADLSPILQQRVHETLEKVAWEAFSDLSETIVKQVMERVERIAWDVIPQMAETLVREEIRKMKGEGD